MTCQDVISKLIISHLSPYLSVLILSIIIFPTTLYINFIISYYECYHVFSQISEGTMRAFRDDFERTQTRGNVTYSIYSSLLFSSFLFPLSFLFLLFFSLLFSSYFSDYFS